MVHSLSRGLHGQCLFLFAPLHSLPTHWIRTRLCKGNSLRIPRPGYYGCCTCHVASLTACSKESQQPCEQNTQQPSGELPTNPLGRGTDNSQHRPASPESEQLWMFNPPVPVKPSDESRDTSADFGLSHRLSNTNQNQLADHWLILVPQKFCQKPLSLGIICYALIDN